MNTMSVSSDYMGDISIFLLSISNSLHFLLNYSNLITTLDFPNYWAAI